MNKRDIEKEDALVTLLLVIQSDPGREYKEEEAPLIERAKRERFIKEERFRCTLSETGRQWLAVKSAPIGSEYTMQKLTREANVALKRLGVEEGLIVRELISELVIATFENRDALRALARQQGVKGHFWHVFAKLKKIV